MSLLLLVLVWLGVPVCQTEDSSGCYWSGPSHGNGDGASFVTLADGRTFTLPTLP